MKKQMENVKEVVLLVTQTYSPFIERKFIRLLRELDCSKYDVLLLMNPSNKNNLCIPTGIPYAAYDMNDIATLGYIQIANTLLPGSCHFLLLKFYLDNPVYKYYWFIEYDMEYIGNWSDLLMTCSKELNQYDFLGCDIERYDLQLNGDWAWWKMRNKVGYPLKKCVKGFNPICRYSKCALECLDLYLKKGFWAHSEVLITTYLHNAGCKIGDFGGTGEFVQNGFENRFYIPKKTIRYRPLYTKPEIESMDLQGKLFHPLKY